MDGSQIQLGIFLGANLTAEIGIYLIVGNSRNFTAYSVHCTGKSRGTVLQPYMTSC